MQSSAVLGRAATYFLQLSFGAKDLSVLPSETVREIITSPSLRFRAKLTLERPGPVRAFLLLSVLHRAAGPRTFICS
jgi:hypothetical protein